MKLTLGNSTNQISIRFTVISIFILATMLTAAIAIGLQYYFSKSLASESASKIYGLTAHHTSDFLTQVDEKAVNTAKLLSSLSNLIDAENLDADAKPVFADVMRSNALFYAIYVGFPNGDYHGLINLEISPGAREQFQASHADRWVYILVTGQGSARHREYFYLDEQLSLRAQRSESSDYYANERPWYVNAKVHEVYKSEPYLFHHLQAPGETYSIKIPESEVVLAVDIALSSVSDYLQTQDLDEHGDAFSEIYLYKRSGELIASNQKEPEQYPIPKSQPLKLTAAQQNVVAEHSVIKVSNETDWAPIDFSKSGMPKGYSIDLLNIISDMTGVEFDYINGFTWPELVEGFKQGELAMLNSLYKTADNEDMGNFTDPFLQLPLVVVTQPGIGELAHIDELVGRTVAIPEGWFVIAAIKTHFPGIEVVELASTKAVLQAVADGEVYAGLDNGVILRYTAKQFFIENLTYHESIDFSLASNSGDLYFLLNDANKELVEIFNLAMANVTADQKAALKLKWFGNGNKVKQVKSVGAVPYPELIEIAKNPDEYNQLLSRTIKDVKHFIYVTQIGSKGKEADFFAVIVPEDTVLGPSLEKVTTSILITSICLLLVLPISWLFSAPIINPIKLLSAENEKIMHRRYKDLHTVDTNIKEIKELADSMLDMSMSIQQYEESQKELMEAFIRLIAQAIDDKSPYTAGHCNRVPELGLMLADAAAESALAPFKDFCFRSEDEHREFRIAAWLHDCGKITTPEYIVDKGTKLEAIYNRIHEVRMRFEVLWRDAELSYFKQLLQTPEQEEALRRELTDKQSQLTEDFEFIASANVGGEFMGEAHVERLHQLANMTWLRHFDNRLGLSPVEELHYKEQPGTSASLPVIEPLLSDRTEHIIKRISQVEFDPKFGIKMEIPEDLYNLGELYNLSISRGTLTAEDRFKINEHVTSTIKMLENLPFPPELARVPRYASTHHETLKGTGYPRKLSAEELSIPERILVVADIFEALTAADRPYKKAKPISVAVDILHKMALDNHLDMDLFKLFLSSGIYLEYANKFLAPAQIDEVDVAKYLKAEERES